MPRRRPAALRAAHQLERTEFAEPPVAIDGLSAGTCLAVRRAERLAGEYHITPGVTGRALREYRWFVHTPGRGTLYPYADDCPCPGCELDDVRHARDVLAEIMARLPARARADLRRAVTPLDRRYLERTLPDPAPRRTPWTSGAWWWHRLTEGT